MSPNEAGTRTPRYPVDTFRLWVSGAAAAFVAALAATVAMLFVRGVLGIPVIPPAPVIAGSSWFRYVFYAAFSALVVTALLHLLVEFAPRPLWFFNWIMFLLAAAVALVPMNTPYVLRERLGTAGVNLATAVAIWGLLYGAGKASTRPRTMSFELPPQGPPQPVPPTYINPPPPPHVTPPYMNPPARPLPRAELPGDGPGDDGGD
ncbi:MAG: hypothetical protein J2P15_18445 [Micromonosporaceae bacterium]|nr:hypothetical protein [Micromonosporaceae bacterium]